MFKKVSLTALSAAVLLLSGCAGFPANNLQKVSVQDLRSTSATKTKVFSRWSMDTSSSSLNEQTQVAIGGDQQKTL